MDQICGLGEAPANGEAQGVPAALCWALNLWAKEPLPSEVLLRATFVQENTTVIEGKVSVIVRKGVPRLNSEMIVGEESLAFTAVAIGQSCVAVGLTFLS